MRAGFPAYASSRPGRCGNDGSHCNNAQLNLGRVGVPLQMVSVALDLATSDSNIDVLRAALAGLQLPEKFVQLRSGRRAPMMNLQPVAQQVGLSSMAEFAQSGDAQGQADLLQVLLGHLDQQDLRLSRMPR